MRKLKDEQTLRVLTLIKLDAQSLYKRIRERKSEYLEIFALRRTRDHFPMIFNNRYDKTTIQELALCSHECILALDQFYQLVDDTRWYLLSTEDMPNTVEDFIARKIARLGKLLETVNLYLDVELGIKTEPKETFTPSIDVPEFDELFSSSDEDDNSHKS